MLYVSMRCSITDIAIAISRRSLAYQENACKINYKIVYIQLNSIKSLNINMGFDLIQATKRGGGGFCYIVSMNSPIIFIVINMYTPFLCGQIESNPCGVNAVLPILVYIDQSACFLLLSLFFSTCIYFRHRFVLSG